jgi:micrococcal nuclease
MTAPVAVLLACLAVTAIDGDTIDCDAERIRIANIDAPEVQKPKCAAERAAGYRAALRLDELLASGEVRIVRQKLDRHRRTLALLTVPAGDVGEILIAEGHARPWRGKRENWCP